MAECRGLAPLARRHALVSTEGLCRLPPGSLARLAFRNGEDAQGGEFLFEPEGRFSSEWNFDAPDSACEDIPRLTTRWISAKKDFWGSAMEATFRTILRSLS